MNKRLDLNSLLKTLLGSNNVYFQPPESIKMSYPAIVYSRQDIVDNKADNKSYKHTNCYSVIVIDKDPDSEIPEKLLENIPMCSYDRHYVSDNLNHDVFTIYY